MTNTSIARDVPVSGDLDLGALLDEVERGTTLVLTRNGRPIAVMAPPSSPEALGSATLAAEGAARYAPSSTTVAPTALLRLVGGAAARSVLGVFVLEPARAVHQREVARRADVGLRSAQLALKRLEDVGLITAERDGNRLYYRAKRSERFEALRMLLAREFGVPGAIARALAPFGSRVKWAFIFGSAVEGLDTVESDVDLLVVGDVSRQELATPLADAQRELSRDIDLVLYGTAEFRNKSERGNHFIDAVLAGPRIDVIGGPDDA